MADESALRLNSWVQHSCNVLTEDKKQSRPLSIWKEQDIWDYIERFDVQICELYYKGHVYLWLSLGGSSQRNK